ncbi:MAG: type II restriction endonuclease [bacterium]|nr:type II restriction endonuclease [bacterium]
MASPICEKAITEALNTGIAILKFISPNDVGVTGGHQCGFYLPKSAWRIFTPYAPVKGRLDKHNIKIIWQSQIETDSVITWYGQGTRSEYRLTRFGKGFPFLIPDSVGDLLMLIPKSKNEFAAYVFDLDDDIQEVFASLGVHPFEYWAVYRKDAMEKIDKESCLENKFQYFSDALKQFPCGKDFSKATLKFISECVSNFEKMTADDAILECYKSEYRLFQIVERRICQPEISRLFKDVDDFLKTAASIMNRRKSRAGRSLENHMDYILNRAKVPHEMRPGIDGRPDIVIPNKSAYLSSHYPLNKLFIVGVKTTCKDRWRQVLNEAKRVKKKHILTLQPSISVNQLNEMHAAGVSLIVPEKLKNDYPKNHPLEILSLEKFIQYVSIKLKK